MTERLPGFFEGTEMPTAGWWEALWPDPAGVLRRVGLEPGMDAVDLCSGDGWFTLQIAKIAEHVAAIDIDAHLLDVARKRLTENNIQNCKFIEADAYDVGTLCPASADFVFMANAFHGVPDKPRLARSVYEALKPGGRFAVVNWHARSREETVILGEPRGPKTELRIGPESVKLHVEALGLKSVGVVEIPPYHYAAIFQKPSAA
jgi:SAM-dependent methyltransferase